MQWFVLIIRSDELRPVYGTFSHKILAIVYQTRERGDGDPNSESVRRYDEMGTKALVSAHVAIVMRRILTQFVFFCFFAFRFSFSFQ